MDKFLVSMFFYYHNFYSRKFMRFYGDDVNEQTIFSVSATFGFIIHNTIALMTAFFCIKYIFWVSFIFLGIIYFYLNKYYSIKIKSTIKNIPKHYNLLDWRFILMVFLFMVIYNFATPFLWDKIYDKCN